MTRSMSMRRFSVPILSIVALAACASVPHRDPEYMMLGSTLPYPFSPVVRVGDMLYLSGQIGTDSAGQVVTGGIQAEARQTLNNIRDVVTRAGSSMDRVVKCTVMMADMKEWPAMNEVYTTFFPTHKPARSAFGATGLALNARVEIECWAVAGR